MENATDTGRGLLESNVELAACLRGAVTAMELIHYEERLYPDSVCRDLPALIERSKAALKEYDK